MRRLAGLLVLGVLAATACSVGPAASRGFRAEFARAVQVFPGVKVRVLGVDVGTVTDVRNGPRGVEVAFRIDRPDVKLPADVRAAIVPMSLLGERYVQLFPSYRGGPALAPGSTIPIARTAVPSEPDELLRSLQDYLGGLDPKVVARFVRNAARVVEGSGDDVNRLLRAAAGVQEVLAERRGDLAELVVQLERVTVALASRQQAVGRVIRSYDEVAGTLTMNRRALEGTVTGLSRAARELASLLVEHRLALGADIDSLTRTGRTLGRNAANLAHSARWASRLFSAASRAIDVDTDWLRLNNQGEPLAELILLRLEQRLVELCDDLGATECATHAYWRAQVPSLFCSEAPCPGPEGDPGEELASAIDRVPALRDRVGAPDAEAGGGGSARSAVEELLERALGREPVGGTP